MITIKKLKSMRPDEIFASGQTEIEHPWFNDATRSLIPGTRNTLVNWIAIRGGIHDWAIYHSLDANLEKSDYLDGTDHLRVSDAMIARHGAKMRREKDIKRCVPCTEKAFDMYRQ